MSNNKYQLTKFQRGPSLLWPNVHPNAESYRTVHFHSSDTCQSEQIYHLDFRGYYHSNQMGLLGSLVTDEFDWCSVVMLQVNVSVLVCQPIGGLSDFVLSNETAVRFLAWPSLLQWPTLLSSEQLCSVSVGLASVHCCLSVL